MGAIRSPKDSSRENVSRVLRDLTPEIREAVEKLIDDYKGKSLEKKLNNLIGAEKTMDLMKKTI